tara:strand:- start:7992 stop:8771 length:780 start_codon:yes stop_codon:yes gene_type:complete
MSNPYILLGISHNVSKEDLKIAYAKKAKKLHPDKPTGNRSQFIKLNEAYRSIKSDIIARQESFHVLKSQSNKQEIFPEKNPNKFNVKKFNRQFEKHYKPQVKPPPLPPNISVSMPKVKGDVSQAFDIFVKENGKTIVNNKQIIKKIKTVDQTQCLGYNELGVTEIADYSDYTNPELLMTDYRKGHTLLTSDANIEYKEKPVIFQPGQRPPPSLYTKEEQDEYEKILKQEEEELEKRRIIQMNMDELAEAQFSRMMNRLK